MQISTTPIQDLYLIDCFIFDDERGQLMKPYSHRAYANLSVNLNFKETWFTKSHKNVIRGMHMQIGEMGAEKLVSVIQGSVLDVVLDTRKQSPTYGLVYEVKLEASKPQALYIPIGCAHGYKVIEEQTITMYMATKVHSAEHDQGVLWNSFGYDWRIKKPIISARDWELPPFK